MSCTAEQIAEKKREAMERLKQTKATATTSKASSNTNNVTSPGTAAKSTSTFYGNHQNDKANALNEYQNKMKTEKKSTSYNRISSQPYPKRNENSAMNVQLKSTTTNNNNNNIQKAAPVFTKAVACSCSMVTPKRFQVNISGYNAKLIDLFKSIPTRAFSKLFCSRKPSFLFFPH